MIIPNAINTHDDYVSFSYETNQPINNLPINQTITFIENEYYFSKLQENIGFNENGSCTIVALCMLLSYYDTFVNDNIISEEYDKTEYIENNEVIVDSVQQFSASPGIIDDFHLDMIKYKQDINIYDGYTMPSNKYLELLNSYYEANDEISFSGEYIRDNVIDNIKENIDNNIPIICTISSNALGDYDNNHAVVAFGYTDSGIIIHSGWTQNDRQLYYVPYSYFIDCFPILVTTNHLHSDNYWYEHNSEVKIFCPCGYLSEVDDTVDYLRCNLTSDYQYQSNVLSNSSVMIEIKSICSHDYNFDINCNYPIAAEVYYRGILQYYEVAETGELDFTFSLLPTAEFYYLRISYIDSNHSGNISVIVSPDDEFGYYEVNKTGPILYSKLIHNEHGASNYPVIIKYIVDCAPVFVQFSFKDSEGFTPNSVVTIKNSNGNIIPKNLSTDSELAIWNNECESIVVYFENNGDYFIDFTQTNINLIEYGSLEINELQGYHEIKINNIIQEDSRFLLNNELKSGDVTTSFKISNIFPMKYNISCTALGDNIGSIKVLLFEKIFSGSCYEYIVTNSEVLSDSNTSIIMNINLGVGEYHIVFYDVNWETAITTSIAPHITTSNNMFNTMVTDPGGLTPSGSHIMMYEKNIVESQKSYRGQTIVEGFSRIIYFSNNAPSTSRLDYDWYCVENIDTFDINAPQESDSALITNYGTIVAKRVLESKAVTIIAVYHYDTSKIFVANFSIIPQPTSTQYVINKYLNVNLKVSYQIDLGNEVPYSWIKAYTWSASPNVALKIENGQFEVKSYLNNSYLCGNYKYNSNVQVIIHITINN